MHGSHSYQVVIRAQDKHRGQLLSYSRAGPIISTLDSSSIQISTMDNSVLASVRPKFVERRSSVHL